jgi:hypothetical protein
LDLDSLSNAVTDLSTGCWFNSTGWNFALEVRPAENVDGTVECDGSVEIRVQQWLRCKSISWIDVAVCGLVNDVGDKSCYTKNNGRPGIGSGNCPYDWTTVPAKCCDDGNGGETMKFSVFFHEGNVECITLDSDGTNGFDTNCGGGGKVPGSATASYEFDLGSAFCGGCYVDDTLDFEIGSNSCASGDCTSDIRRMAVKEVFPFL